MLAAGLGLLHWPACLQADLFQTYVLLAARAGEYLQKGKEEKGRSYNYSSGIPVDAGHRRRRVAAAAAARKFESELGYGYSRLVT